MKSLPLMVLLFVLSALAHGQQNMPLARQTKINPVPELPTHVQNTIPQLPNLKKPGHYTVNDWQQLIDSLWGPGLPTATKLSVFDSFWSIVDQSWGGFPNLSVNWDSLKAVYRPIVAAGVSRGRFCGILSRMVRALDEWHVLTTDIGIDSAMGYIYLDWYTNQYPNYPSYRYQPGIPLININPIVFRTPFGAGLTPLSDSTALVYSVMPNHPLGLQPGDVILGYDGKPWIKALNELFSAELPMILAEAMWGSTPAGLFHVSMVSAGMNWGLFDLIDVVKYSTKDTLHLPTSLLATISPPYHVATEQLPVNGVPFPDLQGNKLVSWGVVQGTNIGYIYAWDWGVQSNGQTRVLFGQAVDELLHKNKVQGLILDFRRNHGGNTEYANDGFSQLFNFDPSSNLSFAIRNSSNHLGFSVRSALTYYPTLFFTPTTYPFDRPIAVLTGPLCGSGGDYNAFRLRFHPMVRFFGKPTNGAYTAPTGSSQYGILEGPYFCRVDKGSAYSNFNNEGYMIHNPFPVDEEVWLTRDGVAKGKDDVVEHALAWIMSLAYAHDVKTSKDTLRSPGDSVTVTAKVENPGGHTLVVSAIITNAQGAQVDSLVLMNDGLHGDGAAGDSVWGDFIKTPVGDGTYGISVRTDDKTSGTFRRLPNAALFDVSLTGVTTLAGLLPRQFSLEQNYPNPFNPATTICYSLPHKSQALLAVYNTLGQQVATLVQAQQEAGSYEVKFDGSSIASGMYFYRLQAGSYVNTKKLLLVR